MFSLIQTHHSLGKATRRSKQSSQRNHRWCWNRQTVGRNHQVSLVIPLTHVETQGWTPIVSFHNIHIFHRFKWFKFDVCYPNLIPKTWNCYTRKWLYILPGINWCFWCNRLWLQQSIWTGGISGRTKTSNQAWRYLSQGYGFYPPWVSQCRKFNEHSDYIPASNPI